MNRKLLVTLLRKDIQELDMITEGFMEMNEYPKAIILLSQRKADDIQSYIKQLAELKTDANPSEDVIPSKVEIYEVEEKPIPAETIIQEPVIDKNSEEQVPEEVQTEQDFTIELLEGEEMPAVESTENTVELIVEQPIIEQPVYELAIEEIKPVAEETRKTVLSERAVTGVPSRNETLSKTDNSIGAILANKKIDDIKHAINIGERFRFQRELFKGNGEDMNKTLNYINQLATLAEVQSFLDSKYNWAEDNESVEDFYQIVRRRFL
ncbi:MAG TPA: hypothetical protein VI413_01405 [Paludibacter sp.]